MQLGNVILTLIVLAWEFGFAVTNRLYLNIQRDTLRTI